MHQDNIVPHDNVYFNERFFNFQAGELLLFDKPYGITSFGLLNRVRKNICKRLKIKKLKVGHAGTLDPLATGLLILCTGKKTKEIDKYQGLNKEYTATLKLGVTTPSYDLETEINKSYATKHITFSYLEDNLKSFLGQQDQIPPVYSAKKINGVRAYEYARKGENIDVRPSVVEIYDIKILDFSLPDIKLHINCSKGTYIRSFVRDLGHTMNSGAVLTDLRRTNIGQFSVEEAFKLEDFIEILNS